MHSITNRATANCHKFERKRPLHVPDTPSRSAIQREHCKVTIEDAAERSGRTLKTVENVAPGDVVWAWDEVGNRAVKRQVKKLFRRRGKILLEIILSTASGREAIRATTEHPFWVEGRGWVPARELRRHDFLRGILQGCTMSVIDVFDVAGASEVYNFEVNDLHNYFVGLSGALVHNLSSLDSGDGPPVTGPVPVADSVKLPPPLIDQLGHPTVAQTVRVASRIAIGASLLIAGERTVEKYQAAYAEAVADDVARQTQPSRPAVYPYGPPDFRVPELQLLPDFSPNATPGSIRMPMPEFVQEFDRFRLARDITLAAEPLELRKRSQFADAPAKVVGHRYLGLLAEYETLSDARDFEIAESKIRQQLRQGDWQAAEGLAHDADIGLTRYNELMDQAYVARRESPYKQAGRALLNGWQFQADLADVGGRALTASPLGQVPGLNGVTERGRMLVSSALWIGYGLSESADIALHGSGGFSGATSYSEAWRKPMWEMAKRGVYNMASEQAGMFLPTPRMREVQTLGRWSMQPDIWGSTAAKYLGMAATDTALGIAGSQAIRWWGHSVDSSVSAPFSDGILPTTVPDAAANGFGYALMYPGLTSGMGQVPWEYRGMVMIGARAFANEVADRMTPQ